jgi:hypothetical protein
MRYLAGQSWSYRTREEDVGSKLTILRVETLPGIGDVVFISVNGLRVLDKNAPGGMRTEIGFTELTASALDRSVTSIDSHVPVPEHQQLYDGWRSAFDRGETEAYREPVASIVEKFQAIFDHVENRRSPLELAIPKVADIFPTFLAELEILLVSMGRSDLSDQLGRLPVVDRCRCGEENCAHFYTAPKPVGSYGPGHENLMLPVEQGLVVLDLVNEAIVGIEILDRPDVKVPLDRYLPPADQTGN